MGMVAKNADNNAKNRESERERARARKHKDYIFNNLSISTIMCMGDSISKILL